MGAAPHALGPDLGAPWEGENIYQIVTDRFFNGEFGNDNASGNYSPAAGQGVHGGDFKGIEQKLDYIKALGATAIWISPVVENGNGDYHGYAARDFYKTAPQMGTLAELKQLVNAAHAKGLRVINDVVTNHGAYDFLRSDDAGYPNYKAPPGGYGLRYRDNAKQYAPPFHAAAGLPLSSLFHNNGFTQDFNNAQQVERGSLQGLDDFNTEHAYVREQMANIYKFWIDEVGFDGFRIDTVKHVEHGFWQSWCPQIRQHAASKGMPNFFMFGEVYDGNDAKVGSYTGTRAGGAFELDSALDYPLYFQINGVFAHGNTPTRHIEDHYHAVDSVYEASARTRLVTFIDNHDQPRFLNVSNANNSLQRLSLALTFQYTARGIPCLYYGTEQGFNGGADPNNREDMFAGQFEQGPSRGDNFNMVHPAFQLVARLNNLRRLYPALRAGTHVSLWNDPSGPGLFAYSRRTPSQEVLTILNTAGVPQTLPSRPTSYPAGTLLVNVLDTRDTLVIAQNGETPSLSVPPLTARVYVAQQQLLPLDPVVENITPAHDAQNVPTPSRIVVRFSKPMEAASVEAAFSTQPATSGAFTWSAAGDQVTFQPSGGFPELSTVRAFIAEGARAADGTQLHARFESRFATTDKTVLDVTPPTVAFTSPKPGEIFGGTLSGTASDDAGVARVEVQLDGGEWITMAGSPTDWTHPLYPQFYINGPHILSARAIDKAGNVSEVVSVPTIFRAVPGAYEQNLIAYGSPGYGNHGCGGIDGVFWSSDKPYKDTFQYFDYGYIGGNVARSDRAIAGAECTAEEYIYRHERYSSPLEGFRYVFKCPPGVYEVTLHNAETFMSGPNQRRFDVYAQGYRVLQNFDIFTAAGGANRAVRTTFTTDVANGLLDVQLRPIYDNARLSAIQVRRIADVFSDSDGVADWWRLAYFGHATGSAADQSRASDDPDGDGSTNLQESAAGTDPHNPLAAFKISHVRKDGADVVIACMGVLPERRYQLQRTESLASGVWTAVANAADGHSPPYGYFRDRGGAQGAQAFYRVIAEQ